MRRGIDRARSPLRKRAGRELCFAAALAAATERIELGTLVLCTSFRNPAPLAKMADTVDAISGGRLILGLGAGWDGPEYRASGYPADRRVARFAGALRIIAPLLRTGRADFVARFYRAEGCELRPRGVPIASSRSPPTSARRSSWRAARPAGRSSGCT